LVKNNAKQPHDIKTAPPPPHSLHSSVMNGQ
jgi:hypothetical protein